MNEEEKLEMDEETGDNEEIESEDTQDDEFEYDDEGNIIIPDVTDDEQEEDTDNEDGDGEDSEEDEESEESEDEGSEESEETPPAPEQDAKDVEIATLKARNAALESQAKETLAKLGVESDDVIAGLEKVAAESDDIPVEEYRKKKAESQRNDEATKLLQKVEFEKKMKADLAEVQSAYPETKGLKAITEIENFAEFGRLRDLGLSPKQAYAAANPDGVRKSVATAVKQQSINDTKSHLRTAVPAGAKDNSIKMPKKDLAYWRDLFPNKTDKELVELYKQSLKK